MREFIISEAEWIIMQILWKHSEEGCSYSTISESLKDNNWSQSTIKTLIRRLISKGYVKPLSTSGRNFIYKPTILEEECKLDEANNFLSKVFNGSISMMVSTLVKKNKISEKDKKELIDIINKMEE